MTPIRFVVNTAIVSIGLIGLAAAFAARAQTQSVAWLLVAGWYDPAQSEAVAGKPRLISSRTRCAKASETAREVMGRRGIAMTTACAPVEVPPEYLESLRKLEDQNQIPLLPDEEQEAKPKELTL